MATELIPVMDLARKLAGDVRAGKKTGDKAIRELIARMSYYKVGLNGIPVYSARLIASASDLIYAAELKSPSYHDPATAEAEQILRDAVREARGAG